MDNCGYNRGDGGERLRRDRLLVRALGLYRHTCRRRGLGQRGRGACAWGEWGRRNRWKFRRCDARHIGTGVLRLG